MRNWRTFESEFISLLLVCAVVAGRPNRLHVDRAHFKINTPHIHAECVYSYTRPIIRDIYSISFQLCSLYDMSDELFIGLRAATFLFLAEGRLNTSIVGLRIDLAAICSVI